MSLVLRCMSIENGLCNGCMQTTMVESYSDIRFTEERGIVTIEIDRPDVLNAFTETTIHEMNSALDRFKSSDSAYVGILTGSGGAFCAGADVNKMPNWPEMGKEEYASFLREVQEVVRKIRTVSKPVIASISGPAIGAGFDFALACDVRFVGTDVTLREGFVNVGLVPGDGGAWLLPKLIGEAKAREYLLSGRTIDSDEAVDLGLASRESSNPREDARSFAVELRDLPATAVRRTKDLLSEEVSFNDHCERAIDYQWDCVNDPEHKEAVSAFREKREPSFQRDY